MKKIYLHTNTEYSFLNSTIRVEQLIKLAKENNLEFLPLTDFENLYALQYYFEMQKTTNIKPLIGIDLNLAEGFIVSVLAKSYEGYKQLNELVYRRSKGEMINFNELSTLDCFIIDHLHEGLKAKNIQVDSYPNNFYLNSKTPLEYQTVYAPVKKVLTEDQNKIIPVLQSIAGNGGAEYHYYTAYLADEDFVGIDENVYQNMLYIAENCNVQAPDASIKLAKTSDDPGTKLLSLINKEKALQLFEDFGEKNVRERVAYEFRVIDKLGFLDYFIIIQGVINYCKQNNISVGPGRGSASGSLISYLIGITDVCPLDFDLLFERFLNVDRVSLPDIDIDIQDNKRDEVLHYIKDKYGEDKVALISVFQTLALKNSLRDIGRYLNIPLAVINKVCNSLKNDDTSLEEAYFNNTAYRKFADEYPELHYFASSIEGLPRQIGIHAAGIIICDRPLRDVVPVTFNQNTLPQVQFTLNYLERFGLIKIDFLGLKNLTIIQEIEEELPMNKNFDYIIGKSYAKFFDTLTSKLLNKLLTNGIFQLESPGMQNAIREVGIDSFDDLYAIISLFRPGPMQYIKTYAANKKNPSLIKKLHPLYDEIVENTFGIIVYQEQIMQIAQRVANMTFAQADLLRRAISKKDESKLISYKKAFFDGGIANGVPSEVLDDIYANIERFAAYGFNKSHAVAYAVISYKLAYYKAHYPFLFYKILISNYSSDQTTIKKYVSDALAQGIKVKSPDINISTDVVTKHDNTLYLPIIMVKGVGAVAAQRIVEERITNGEFKSFIDAFIRLKINANISDSVLEFLIKSNTFRSFGNVETLLLWTKESKQYIDFFKKSIKKLSEEDIKEEFDKLREQISQFVDTIPKRERDLQKELQYESELLGDIYNCFSALDDMDNLINLASVGDKPTWVEVYMSKVSKDPKGRPRIAISDRSTSVMSYGFSERAAQILNATTPRIIRALLKVNKSGYYTFLDWQEVNNEK
ncbi:DNA polymerase III subunit alpha [Mycoplasma sp. Pen4]|uniref:DNA polymerase III subunit alpha n=1 Tax=Mycoplasma sp. Pen4 TaxID=640330 RepID=UPI001654739A|nr:DNA polymerase III subunit alpha [Mycoplasma sp. Pen4]QNM93838.1 DNA polymerase III subunit alpha [Mycoplasma sp. Pen4]